MGENARVIFSPEYATLLSGVKTTQLRGFALQVGQQFGDGLRSGLPDVLGNAQF